MTIWQKQWGGGNVLEGTESSVTRLQSSHWDRRWLTICFQSWVKISFNPGCNEISGRYRNIYFTYIVPWMLHYKVVPIICANRFTLDYSDVVHVLWVEVCGTLTGALASWTGLCLLSFFFIYWRGWFPSPPLPQALREKRWFCQIYARCICSYPS